MSKTNLITIVFILCNSVSFAQLRVDFNSTNQDGGPNNLSRFQPYNAAHEVAGDFVTRDYSVFDAFIGLTPTWPDTNDRRVQQMIDRGNANDASWMDVDDEIAGTVGLDLITDFLGIDTRPGNGGNGNWNGTSGNPTTLHLTLAGLPAAAYEWTSYHHDTENLHGEFEVQISIDGGATFEPRDNGVMTDGTTGGNPDSQSNSALWGSGSIARNTSDMQAAGSIYSTSFTSDGTNDVVIQFQPYAGVAVHQQVWGINGFELQQGELPLLLPCDSDADNDCDQDDIDGLYDQINTRTEGQFDFDGDGKILAADIRGWLAAASVPWNEANPSGNTLEIGDTNFDGFVDSTDLGNLLNNFGTNALSAGSGVGWTGGDLNADGKVDSTDLGEQLNLFGFITATSSIAVPEPSAAATIWIFAFLILVTVSTTRKHCR